MKRINLYVFIQIIKSCTLVFFIFISIAWLMQLSRLFSAMSNMQIEYQSIFFLSLFLIPNLINVLIPFVVIFGLILTFIKLDKDRELIAIFTLGLSMKQVKLPIILITLFFLVIYMILNLFLSPYVYKEYKKKEFRIKNEININDINLSNFLEIENIILDFKKDNNEFKEIFINYKDKKENIIYAKKGKIINEDGKIIFNLFNGFKLSFIDEENEKLEFENYKLEFLLNSLPTYKILDKNSQTILNIIEEKNYSMIVEKFFDFIVLLIIVFLFYKFNIKSNNYKLNSIFIFLFVSIFINIAHNIIKNIELDFQLLLIMNITNIAISILLIEFSKKITNE